MRVNKTAVAAFMISCLIFSSQARCVVITPSIVEMPYSPGEQFSFDLIVKKLPGSLDAKGCQTTVEVDGLDILTFNEISSKAVSDNPSYWLRLNTSIIISIGSNKYGFGDGPLEGNGTLGVSDSIVARYAFDWTGIDGLCRFIFDFENLNENYVLGLPPDYESYPLELPQGNWYSYPIVDADISSFTVAIPEPGTLILFALGSAILLRKHKT